MKRILFCFLIIPLFLVTFGVAEAQTNNREALLAELQSLLVQLANLQSQIAEQNQRPYRVTSRKLAESKYYDGDYEAIYVVDATELEPYRNTVWDQVDQELWILWRDVLGERTVREYIREFRIYNDVNSDFDAFVEQIGTDDDWIFAVNRAWVDLSTVEGDRLATELFVHEYAHILYHYEPEIAEDFVEEFWRPYSRLRRNYVSDYAMVDEEEDFAESFMHFALDKSPDRNGRAWDKIDFFADYGVFRNLKAEINSRI